MMMVEFESEAARLAYLFFLSISSSRATTLRVSACRHILIFDTPRAMHSHGDRRMTDRIDLTDQICAPFRARVGDASWRSDEQASDT